MKNLRPFFCALILLLFSCSLAGAHPMPNSEVKLRVQQHEIDAQLTLPLIELRLGWEKPFSMDADAMVAQYGESLKGYVHDHIHPTAPDGRPWTVTIGKVTPLPSQVPDVQLDVVLTPPPGAPVGKLNFGYDVIFHKLITHSTIVSIERDWNTGLVSGRPVLLGTMDYQHTSLPIDRSQGGWFYGFKSVFLLGVRHIAEGTDHLLFLLVLLLPAALIAEKNHWGGAAPVRQSVGRLLKIVTAFTVGHSLTLAAGALGWVHVPSKPIEVLIAVSILVSAVHAFRPIFPGREIFIAGGFGLIHGLAFASVISEFGLDTWHTVLAIFGFNIGIEAMQLFVVAVTVPWFLILARTAVYTPIRIAGVIVASIASLGWIAERALGWHNPAGIWVERAADHAVWIIGGLAVISLVATLAKRFQTERTVEPVAASLA